MSEQHPNVATIDAMTTAVFEQDHATLARVMTDDLEFHLRGPVPFAGDYRGVGGFLEALGGMFETTSGQIDLDQQFCMATDGWAAEFEHATLGRNGQTLVSRNALIYRFEGGRIAEMWMFLGAAPAAAEAFLAA